MSESDIRHLEDLLRRLESAQGSPPADAVPEADRALLADVHAVAEALRRAAAADEGPHLSLDELRRLVTRQKAAADDESLARDEEPALPEHVAACRLCLEAFELLRQGVDPVPEAALERYRRLLPASQAPTIDAPAHEPSDLRPRRLRVARWAGALAAVLVLAAAVTWSLVPGSTSARLDAGTVVLDNGRAVARGSRLPEGRLVLVQAEAQTTFADGSRLDLLPDTHLSIEEGRGGDITIDLREGRLIASVVKDPASRRQFGVRTRLGDIIAVGTRFSVTARSEDVTVFVNPQEGAGGTGGGGGPGGAAPAPRPGYPSRITAVTVEVLEGAVRIRTPRDEAQATAGQVAVLRENQAMIAISGGD